MELIIIPFLYYNLWSWVYCVICLMFLSLGIMHTKSMLLTKWDPQITIWKIMSDIKKALIILHACMGSYYSVYIPSEKFWRALPVHRMFNHMLESIIIHISFATNYLHLYDLFRLVFCVFMVLQYLQLTVLEMYSITLVQKGCTSNKECCGTIFVKNQWVFVVLWTERFFFFFSWLHKFPIVSLFFFLGMHPGLLFFSLYLIVMIGQTLGCLTQVVYINGRPFVLRDVERPFSNLEYTVCKPELWVFCWSPGLVCVYIYIYSHLTVDLTLQCTIVKYEVYIFPSRAEYG